MRIAYETMLAEFERVLTKYGFSPERAHEAAEIFAQNSLAGVFSHGLNRFPRVVEYLRKGEIDPVSARPSALPALVPWSAGTASAALAR